LICCKNGSRRNHLHICSMDGKVKYRPDSTRSHKQAERDRHNPFTRRLRQITEQKAPKADQEAAKPPLCVSRIPRSPLPAGRIGLSASVRQCVRRRLVSDLETDHPSERLLRTSSGQWPKK
jgi:hypothetical protein